MKACIGGELSSRQEPPSSSVAERISDSDEASEQPIRDGATTELLTRLNDFVQIRHDLIDKIEL